jgi:hypothetical protein
VASIHFGTTLLGSCNHPHTISLHLSFLRRSAIGRATFIVDACKIGKNTSVIHVSVTQSVAGAAGGRPTPFAVGYLTHANLIRESGLSLPTHFSLSPPPVPRGSTAALRANADPNWVLQQHNPSISASHSQEGGRAQRKQALQQVQFYIPRGRRVVAPATIDEWICLSSGERFTQESLGFVCDTFPLVPEAFGLSVKKQTTSTIKAEAKPQGESESISEDVNSRNSNISTSSPSPSPSASSLPSINLSHFWFPTLVLNIEIKKLLPPEGVEWLFVRVRSKQVRNGRMDLEAVVLDEEGDIVALSSHVALLLSEERNVRGRL